MKKAAIAVGEDYAVGRRSGSPEYWQRVTVLAVDAPRRVYTAHSFAGHINKDGVKVRFLGGTVDVVALPQIRMPWSEAGAIVAAAKNRDEALAAWRSDVRAIVGGWIQPLIAGAEHTVVPSLRGVEVRFTLDDTTLARIGVTIPPYPTRPEQS